MFKRKKRKTSVLMLDLLRLFLVQHEEGKELADKEKLELAERLAMFVEVTRHEYGLTSAYYTPAEFKIKEELKDL